MRLLKTHPILGLLNSYMVDSPQPASISYMWNFGSLLGACLIIQIITGITLAMHYTPSIDLAFVSVEHILFKPSPMCSLNSTLCWKINTRSSIMSYNPRVRAITRINNQQVIFLRDYT
jgi:hypothetical protein